MKSLIIAEKPSVAADLARALGKVPKKGDFYENDEYVISSAVGHLIELEMPEDIDKKKYGFWRLDALPIIPKKFGLKVIDSSKSKFTLLKKLLARKDIDQVINACDAGREGELIFTYIYQYSKSKLPVKRAWMQTMTPEGIRQAFRELRDNEQMLGLADAARCRSESDWLIGINGTRAITKRMFGSRGGNVATVGRVQTPTLAILYKREEEIRNFIPRTYWRITAKFSVSRGSYEGVYQRPGFKKSSDDQDRIDRIWDEEQAKAILVACQGTPVAHVRENKKSSSKLSPRLYDLTTLQREANNRFGLSARRTLQIAQALYEKHKMITYPRTDSRALPEDYISTCKSTLFKLDGEYREHAQKALEAGYVHPNKRIFNNAQISDHFAIIPTGVERKKLDEMESKVYDMIVRRFIAVFYPAAEYDVTTRISTIGEHDFKTEGKVLTNPGWLAVYGKTAIDDDDDKKDNGKGAAQNLPALTIEDNNRAQTLSATLHTESTKPPPHFTEATLLSAMEGAGKLVDDEELADAMKERGLGTPATRAETIDGLINQKYLERVERNLIPTAKAEQLLQFLSAVKAEELTQPRMTGEWEYKLRQMEQGKFSREKFMKEIIDVTIGIVDRARNFEERDRDAQTVPDMLSPTDSQPMLDTLRAYKSQDGKLTVYKIITGRKMQEDEIRKLLSSGEIGPLDDFVSPRTGRRFSSKLRLITDPKDNAKLKVELDFGSKVDLTELHPFWTDSATQDELCETSTNYILRHHNGSEWEQTFSVGRIMCKRPISREEAISLVSEGKTPLIEDFTSKYGRPFKAFLVKRGNKAAFEFPPREAKEKQGEKPARTSRKKTLVDLDKARAIGASKAHAGAPLYETDDAYIVAKPGDDNKPYAAFEVKKVLCQKEIPQEEILTLLDNGKTNLIEGFVSKRGNPFSAYLVLSRNKTKAEFEFPPK